MASQQPWVITAQELSDEIVDNDSLILLDVREPEENEEGAIDDSILIPHSKGCFL